MAKATNKIISRNEPAIEEEVFEKKIRQRTEKPIEKDVYKVSIFSKIKTIITTIKEIFTAPLFVNTLGVVFILGSIYLVIAFVSYIYTWQTDQDKVLMPAADLLINNEITVNNWLGKFGAISAHSLMHNMFGIGSFVLLPLLFAVGVKLIFNFSLFAIRRSLLRFALTTIWLSVVMACMFKNDYFFLGGSIGYQLSNTLNAVLGTIGTYILLGLLGLIFAIIIFKFNYNLFETSDEIPEHEEFDEVDTKIIQNTKNAIKQNLATTTVLDDDDEYPFVNEQDIEVELSVNNNPVSPSKNTILPKDDLDFEIQRPAEEAPKEAPLVEFNVVQQQLEKERVANSPHADEEALAQSIVDRMGLYDPRADLSDYKFPTADILNQNITVTGAEVSTEELRENKDKILKTLLDFGIEIDKIKATIGPTVVLYEIVPKAGVKISKIKNLEDDIALNLAALGIRIIAPMPGKGTIGIEVPNSKPQIVPMSAILASEKFMKCDYDLPIALGKTISNEIFIADLAKMPHLLMAGATGQGKSVGLNAILASLLFKKHPSELKFVLVDPKKVELTLFNKIERHFLAKLPDADEAIITDTKKVVHTLNSLCIEMDARYELLKNAQVRNIKEYNAKFVTRRLNPLEGHQFLPYIVVVVDEFADLIITAGKEVEMPIARIAQLARAVGIHLIIATQRPSVNVITGTIKANFPGRIAFRVASKIDSRTILDAGGADQLIGRGDLLLTQGNDLVRIQCAFIDTPEVELLCEYIGGQRGYSTALLLPEYIDENGDGGKKEDVDMDKLDSMFNEAARLIVQHQQGSTSLIQRRLKLGYNRAGRIIDQLEAIGIVGAFEGSKARQVNIKTEADLEEILASLKK
ncbi:MAG: DNA translocase FtsK 4TM domain-containing protein [Bacteroidia bacterium]|nr:DNA translocase FtsK 4TM domain-containing protein [Bacteroidia bacterium]